MRKIGELKGKPIIEGNPNEIKKNQIHYKESDGGITLSERKEDNTLSSVTSGSGSGESDGIMEVEYLYIKGPALSYNKAIGVVGAVGKYSVGTTSLPNTFTAFSAGGIYTATIKGFKLVKGLFKENNTIYNTTTYDKFIETYELDPSSYEEITKEYYENIENWK